MDTQKTKLMLMPLRRAVVYITNEASIDDEQEIRRAIKGWHNKLSNGSVPRSIFRKIGKHLFMDIVAFEEWVKNQ